MASWNGGSRLRAGPTARANAAVVAQPLGYSVGVLVGFFVAVAAFVLACIAGIAAGLFVATAGLVFAISIDELMRRGPSRCSWAL